MLPCQKALYCLHALDMSCLCVIFFSVAMFADDTGHSMMHLLTFWPHTVTRVLLLVTGA